MIRSGWCPILLAVAVALVPIRDLHAQSIPSAPAPTKLLLPKPTPEDNASTLAVKSARGTHNIFTAVRQIASGLTPLPQYESFKTEITPLRTEIRWFRANYIAFVCAEKPGSFGHAVFQAADMLFAGADAWDIEIRAEHALEHGTGTLKPLRARIARDAAADQGIGSWNAAQQWIQNALALQPHVLDQLQQAERAQGASGTVEKQRQGTSQEQQQQPSGYWLCAVSEELSDVRCGAPLDLSWKGGFMRQTDCEAAGGKTGNIYECRPIRVGAGGAVGGMTPAELLDPEWASAVRNCLGAGQQYDGSFDAFVSGPGRASSLGSSRAQFAFKRCLTEAGQLLR